MTAVFLGVVVPLFRDVPRDVDHNDPAKAAKPQVSLDQDACLVVQDKVIPPIANELGTEN